MFFIPINITTFHFSPAKIFLQLLVPIFMLIFIFSNEIMQKCVEYCKNKIDFFLTKLKLNMNF